MVNRPALEDIQEPVASRWTTHLFAAKTVQMRRDDIYEFARSITNHFPTNQAPNKVASNIYSLMGSDVINCDTDLMVLYF